MTFHQRGKIEIFGNAQAAVAEDAAFDHRALILGHIGKGARSRDPGDQELGFHVERDVGMMIQHQTQQSRSGPFGADEKYRPLDHPGPYARVCLLAHALSQRSPGMAWQRTGSPAGLICPSMLEAQPCSRHI
jgi:hypothetical protein